VEAEAVGEIVAAMDEDTLARLEKSVARAAEDRCAALDEDGKCLVYEGRPMVCRSHGVPVRLERRGLKVIESCELNFTERGPAAADADCVLDQTTLSATVLAIDRARGGDGERYELRDVIEAELRARRR
jgi:Fe-S-cluster containining protein